MIQPDQSTGSTVCYSPTLKIYVSLDDSGAFRNSSDGINWNRSYPCLGYKIESMYWNAQFNCFVVLGKEWSLESLNVHRVKISIDGINWQEPFYGKAIFYIIFKGIKAMNTAIEEENKEMKKTIEELKGTVADLKEMITQMFYAPGMPGFIEAQKDFENIATKK